MARRQLALLSLIAVAAHGFVAPLGSTVVSRRAPVARMMFGGGDKDGEGGFMDKLKVGRSTI